ncbi:MAG TPA: hypothetical protein ENH10_03115 [Bacteroidetes bacterium]|nr:hypothetical protein [Bacteroidota bacterium]HEX04132.1 hypothetical protein [Bacteroidota bacterium]
MLRIDVNAWSRHTFSGCSLGDFRRVRRLIKIAAMLVRHPLGSIPECSGDSRALLEGDRGHVVGLLDQAWWTRDRATAGKGRDRKRRRYEDKESYKWEAASRRSADRLGPELMSRVATVHLRSG